jgi:hypothetical protein
MVTLAGEMVSKPQALDTGSGDGREKLVLDQMRRQTEDIIRYYGELNRRVAGTGMEGIPRLLELSRQVELAVGELAEQELAWAGDEIKRLLDQLVKMTSQLERLRELKMLLEPAPEPTRRSAAPRPL